MHVRFLFASLTAAAFFWASSSLAYTPLNLRISAPAFTESLQEHLRQTWKPDAAFTRWGFWGDTTYTNLKVKDIEISITQSIITPIDEEELEAVTVWGGADFHLGQNVLVGILGSYQTVDSTQTFGVLTGTPSATLSTTDTNTESFGGGAYLGFRFQNITLHTAIAALLSEIDDNPLSDTRDLFLSAALNQDFTVSDDFLSLGWHVSGTWSNRTYGEEFKFEDKNSFTRGEAGIRIGLNFPQIEIFALANANYDTFSDEQSIGMPEIAIIGSSQIPVPGGRMFSFAEEEEFGANVGGGVEIAFTDGLKFSLFGQYTDFFRDSYEGYSGSVQLSYTWTEGLSLSSGVSAREEESIWSIRVEHAL